MPLTEQMLQVFPKAHPFNSFQGRNRPHSVVIESRAKLEVMSLI